MKNRKYIKHKNLIRLIVGIRTTKCMLCDRILRKEKYQLRGLCYKCSSMITDKDIWWLGKKLDELCKIWKEGTPDPPCKCFIIP